MIPLLMSLAQAAPSHSLALDVGRLDLPDGRHQDLMGGMALATYGVRGVYDLERWRALDVTYGLRFSERRVDFGSYDDETGYSSGALESRWFHNTAALGVRLQGQLGWEGFQPFVRGQATVDTGVLRLDEDFDDKDNVNAIRKVGVAPGVELVAGVDILPAPYGMDFGPDISPLLYLELGWNRTAQMSLDEVGDVRFGGFVVRTGLGVAF